MRPLIALVVVLVCPSVFGKTSTNVGDGDIVKLDVLADAWLDDTTTNHDNDQFLSIGYLHDTEQKRALLRFEDLTVSDCPAARIRWAKMYLHYNGVYRDSETVTNAREYSYKLQVHPLTKSWTEDQVTGKIRSTGNNWGTVMVGTTNGVDAKIDPQDCPTTIFASRPNGFVEFDVTNLARGLVEVINNKGVIVYAIDEAKIKGVDIRFTSDTGTSSEKAFINVLCDKP